MITLTHDYALANDYLDCFPLAPQILEAPKSHTCISYERTSLFRVTYVTDLNQGRNFAPQSGGDQSILSPLLLLFLSLNNAVMFQKYFMSTGLKCGVSCVTVANILNVAMT